MKKIIILIYVSLLVNQGFTRDFYVGNSKIYNDSTLKERFLKSILEDTCTQNVWILVEIDSLNQLKNNFEVMHPIVLYEYFAESYRHYSKKNFIEDAVFRLTDSIPFERYANRKHILKGIKISSKRYAPLAKKSFEKILAKYFNKHHRLKKKYDYLLYELIAACYINNTKLITPSNGARPYYVKFI